VRPLSLIVWGEPRRSLANKITRHRLNRGANRDATDALWRIAMVRLAYHHQATDA